MRKLETGFTYEDGTPIHKYDIVELFASNEERWPLGIYAVVENYRTGKFFLRELDAEKDHIACITLTLERASHIRREGGLYEDPNGLPPAKAATLTGGGEGSR